MNQSDYPAHVINRLDIAGLFTLSFLGYIMHSVLHNLFAHGKDPKVLAETAEVLKLPSTQIMMFVFVILAVAPAFMAFVFRGKTGWRILTILALVIIVLNGLHSISHIAQGDFMNGGTTFVLQMVPGVLAVIWSFKFLKTFNE